MKISQRGQFAPASPIRKLVPLASEAKKRGVKVYHLNIGQPDFEAPPKVLEKLKELSLSTKIVPYADSRGEKGLVGGWQKYYQNIGIQVDHTEIMITTGGSEAIIFAMLATMNPAEYAGLVEWNGTKCHKLNVTLPLGTIAAYLVDASNFRVRLVAVDETYEGKTYHLEREWLDLSPVDGILLPKRMTYSGGEAKTAIAEVRTIEAERDQSIR